MGDITYSSNAMLVLMKLYHGVALVFMWGASFLHSVLSVSLAVIVEAYRATIAIQTKSCRSTNPTYISPKFGEGDQGTVFGACEWITGMLKHGYASIVAPFVGLANTTYTGWLWLRSRKHA